MDLKTILLLKLVCCGGPLLILLLPWAAISAILAGLGGEVWYRLAAALVVAGVLLWLFRRPCGTAAAGELGDPAAIRRQKPWAPISRRSQ